MAAETPNLTASLEQDLQRIAELESQEAHHKADISQEKHKRVQLVESDLVKRDEPINRNTASQEPLLAMERIDGSQPQSEHRPLMLSNSAFSQKNPSPDGKWPEFWSDIASDEVLMHIFSFLDDKTLFGCALVCKRFNQLGEDKRLWTRHNRNRWKKSKDGRGNIIEGKPFYKQQMLRFKEQLREMRQRQREAEVRLANERKARERRELWGPIWWCSFNAGWQDIILMLLIMLFVVLVSVRIDRLITWNWALVFLPLLIVIGWLSLRSLSNSLPVCWDISSHPPDDHISIWTLVLVWMCGKDDHSNWSIDSYLVNYFAIISSLVCVALFPVLIAVRLAGVDISMTIVFTPLYVAWGLCIIWSILFYLYDHLPTVWAVWAIVAGYMLPWMIYFVLIGLKVDGHLHASWALVHIPLWIGFGLYICVPLCILPCSSSLGETLFAINLGVVCCPGLLIVCFQILLCVKLGVRILLPSSGGLHGVAWRTLFVPLYVTFAGLVGLGITTVILFMC